MALEEEGSRLLMERDGLVSVAPGETPGPSPARAEIVRPSCGLSAKSLLDTATPFQTN